ncbi:MAG: polysaccharide biosynthesis C-terminal domain-containing protein [Ktedonobacteraceae bacterium]|nr:polysaccharide biosynthesis C-terminal domain-containing protein [Ktedonobacteraceae bacterium]
MGSTVLTSVIGYLYWVVAVHLYSAHDIGLVSAIISVTTLTSSLANPGIGPTLIQMLPHRASGYAWSVTLNAGLVTGTFTSLLAGIILVIALPLYSDQFAILGQNVAYATAFIVGVPLWTVTTLLDQTFVAERATVHMLTRNVIFAILKLLFMLVLAHIGVFGIFSSWVLALVLSVIIGALLVPRLKRAYCFALRGLIQQVRAMLSSLAWHHFANLGSTLPMYLLPVFVTIRLSATDNAYFYTGWMLGSIFFMVSPAVATSLFSEGSHRTDNLLRKVSSSAVIIGALLAPAMLTVFVAGYYILLLFGHSYADHSLLLLTILTVSAVPDAITNIYVSVLRIQRRLRLAAFLNLGMAFLTLLLTLILLPILGIAGAGWAFLLSQAAGSVIAIAEFVATHYKQPQRAKLSREYAGLAAGQRSRSDPCEMEPAYLTAEQLRMLDEPTLKLAAILLEKKDTQKLAAILLEKKDTHIAKKSVSRRVPKKIIFQKLT